MSTERSLYRQPTLFEDISIITAVYKQRLALPEVLESHGYRLYQEIKVPEVTCFLYTPLYFPKDRKAGEQFDFVRYRNQRCTLGLCIGGLMIRDNTYEAVIEALEQLKSHENDHEVVDDVATTILTVLKQFVEDFPQLARENIAVEINISGYCLGGLFAQMVTIQSQKWRTETKIQITCRTFESCGLPERYHAEAEQYTQNNKDYWKNGITNYKWFPNPFNCVFADLGQTFHLMNPNAIISDKTWKKACLAASIKRVTLFHMASHGFDAVAVSCAVHTCQGIQAYQDAPGLIASDFGLTHGQVARTHNIELGLTCFDENRNLCKEYCREMSSWSTWKDLKIKRARCLAKNIRKMIPFHLHNCGIHTYTGFGGKEAFIERRLRRLPGYKPSQS